MKATTLIFMLVFPLLVGCAPTSYTAKDALAGMDLSKINDKACVRGCTHTYSNCVSKQEVGRGYIGAVAARNTQEACGSALQVCVATCE